MSKRFKWGGKAISKARNWVGTPTPKIPSRAAKERPHIPRKTPISGVWANLYAGMDHRVFFPHAS